LFHSVNQGHNDAFELEFGVANVHPYELPNLLRTNNDTCASGDNTLRILLAFQTNLIDIENN